MNILMFLLKVGRGFLALDPGREALLTDSSPHSSISAELAQPFLHFLDCRSSPISFFSYLFHSTLTTDRNDERRVTRSTSRSKNKTSMEETQA